MITRCFLISVMHTGTTFLEQLVKPSLGFHHVHRHMLDKVLPGLAAADVVIAPLRDPRSVWRSFTLRDEPRTYFWEGWQHLAEIDAMRPVLYVPVDLFGIRDACLAAVGSALNRDIATDWQPRGQYRGERDKPDDPVDLSSVYALPPVARFYAPA